MTWRPLVLMATAFVALGCGRRTTPRATSPQVVPAPVRVDPLSQPWRLSWRPNDSVAYRISVTTELRSESDGRERVDSLASQLDVSLGAAASGSDVVLHVARYATRLEPDTAWRVPAGVSLPATLRATPRRGAIPELCRNQTPECAPSLLAVTQGWQELWLGDAPSVLRPDMEWTDSTETVVLRDSIPLRVSTLRRFRVIDARVDDQNRVVVRLQRRSTALLRGEGRQFGELIRLSGSGEGETMLDVALPSGEIVSGAGRSVLRLEMLGRRRTQRLEQHSETEIAVP